MAIAWIHRFADLLAIGVHIDVEAMHVLDKGGEVLAIEILPAPDSWLYGDGDLYPMSDHDGNTAMLPYLLKVTPPDQPFDQGWRTDPISIADYLEKELGDEWRLFPSYTGVKYDVVVDDPRGLDENLMPVRVWNALPLMSEEDRRCAGLILTAHRQLIADSYYEEVTMFYRMEMEISEGWSDIDLKDMDDEPVKAYWHLRRELAAKGYIAEEDDGMWAEKRAIDFEPIEFYLRDPHARVMWRRLLHESRLAATRVFHAVPKDKQSLFIHNEKEWEPWF